MKRPTSTLTDELLRSEIEAGAGDAEIGLRYGVSRQAVSKRRNRLGLTTVAATTMQPAEAQRFVQQNLNLVDTLARGLHLMEWLIQSEKEWLEDPVTGKANINPRAHEIEVIYYAPDSHSESGAMVKKRESLQTLLDRALDDGGLVYEGWDSRIADARTNITAHQAEVRKTVDSMTNLYEKMLLHRAVQRMIDTTREIIARVSPEQADYLRRELCKVWVLEMPSQP